MWPPTVTDCECTKAGWCERHECYKTGHWHLLCRRQHTMFQKWELGQGPCLPIPPAEPQPEAGEPGAMRKATNFGKAIVKHIADGLVRLDEETYQHRLSICRSCDSCDQQRMMCLQPACGCRLRLKARWHSEVCPIGKWPPVNEKDSDGSTDNQ